jgi:hypothetical protein
MNSQHETDVDPDPEREILLRAHREVQQILQARQEQTEVKLFLPLHYPFFDKNVQRVLLERHPTNCPKAGCYAGDAYLWAEQYAWIAYRDLAIRSHGGVAAQASFYFAYDLRWFEGNPFLVKLQHQVLHSDEFEKRTSFACLALPFSLDDVANLSGKQLNSFLDMRAVYDPARPTPFLSQRGRNFCTSSECGETVLTSARAEALARYSC